ncbi:MAG: alanine:cation symporter family protein [Bacteroidales bacterium]|nr:alanine:cation symporter family protein [Bacteroidales bacterium]
MLLLKRIFTLLFIILITSATFAIEQDSIPNDQENKATVSEKINGIFEPFVETMANVLFWDPFSSFGLYDPVVYDKNGKAILDKNGKPIEKHIPIIVFWLVFGAIFFTIKMKFVNFRSFRHAIGLVQGKYDNPNDEGEVSHFQALATALSGTVGLGNIAGVAIAITIGGPGATFWMIVAGLFGMASKFTEVTLGVKYRNILKNGEVSGGPMYYLSKGLKKRNLGGIGMGLAILFAILVIGASFGGGNMFQANQAFKQFEMLWPEVSSYGAWFGLVIAILVGIVIIGGIKSIARVTEKIVPFMAILYIGTALVIIGINIGEIHHVFVEIFNGAFAPGALKGGIIGVLIVGFQRAAFSNEAGIGSASIAHSAVKTEEPVSEGIVALLEPFIDTVVICTLTALVIIFTGFHNPEVAAGLDGAQLTSQAFASVFSWFPYLLVVAILLFAFSTMISWSYYGLKGFNFLFKEPIQKLTGRENASKYIYFVIFLSFTIVGAASSMTSVMDFSDMMILSMGFPNIVGLLIMAPEVAKDLKPYLERVKDGRIKKYK